MRRAAILAVDGGNSKTEILLVGADGRRLAFVRGGTVSHQAAGWETGLERLRRLVAAARTEAGLTSRGMVARIGSFCLAGADSRAETARLQRALRDEHLVEAVHVLNDSRAALRAGSPAGWGVAVICGTGVNAVGVGPDGRVAALPALGPISGDWGGGRAVGEAGLAAAIRGRDGRGPHTSLERTVPTRFGLARPLSVTWALYRGRLSEDSLLELCPVVFADARGGDAVAREIIDRLADELAVMAVAALRRLRLLRRTAHVVLAGGVMQAHDPAFFERLADGVHAHAPLARIHRLTEPPVVGAALLGLDALGYRRAAETTLRTEVTQRPPTEIAG
jgi:N-acetylglucosamine kinase-like BadF-type ATPase